MGKLDWQFKPSSSTGNNKNAKKNQLTVQHPLLTSMSPTPLPPPPKTNKQNKKNSLIDICDCDPEIKSYGSSLVKSNQSITTVGITSSLLRPDKRKDKRKES